MRVTARPSEPTWWATAGFITATATVSWEVETRCPFHPGRRSTPKGVLCAPCQRDLDEQDPGLGGLPIRRKRKQ